MTYFWGGYEFASSIQATEGLLKLKPSCCAFIKPRAIFLREDTMVRAWAENKNTQHKKKALPKKKETRRVVVEFYSSSNASRNTSPNIHQQQVVSGRTQSVNVLWHLVQ